MANLGPQRINQSFGDLLQLPNGLTGSLQAVQDGSGNVTPLQISNTDVQTTFIQAGTGAVTRTMQDKGRETVSVLDFGAVGDGVTDDTAEIQSALTYAVDNGKALYFPGGEYLVSDTIVIGNASGQSAKPIVIIGEGNNSVIKSVITLPGGALRIRGSNPEIDASRHFGKVIIEDIVFKGPGRYSLPVSGLGLAFSGVQGISLTNVHSLGWSEAIKFHNCDLVTMVACQMQANTTGIATENSGYALGGQLNSFTVVGCWFNNCTQYGVDYHGGLKPSFIGCNFSSNGTSLNISNTSEIGATTQSPTIENNYFESDDASIIILGGNAGIVTSGSIKNNTMLVKASTTAITVGNIQNSSSGVPCTIYDNVMSVSGGIGSYTEITQATSIIKADYKNAFAQVKPCFHATVYPAIANLTGGGTTATIIFNVEGFDRLGNYDPTTGVFTAPFTGIYLFNWNIRFYPCTASNTNCFVWLEWSGGTDYDMYQQVSPSALIGADQSFIIPGSVTIPMNVGETVRIKTQITGPSDTVGVVATPYSWFCGQMISS